MPTDHVENRKFRDLLNGTVRFKIPFFQRGYSWTKKQWDQLFIDMQEQIIEELASDSTIDEVEYFFGPIVVMEQTGTTELKEFLVIDGQQRITTVYLLLGTIREQIRAKAHLSGDAHDYLKDLEKYLWNDVGGSDDYLKLKVFSPKGDRLPTYRLIFGTDANPKTPMLAIDIEMYIPGKNGIDAFRKYALRKLKANHSDVPALWQLAQVLLNCLTIVWIPLDDQKDDAQAIFESLNDKGLQLTGSELLCNYLFQPIIQAKENFEDLHNRHWLPAIRMLEGGKAFEEYLRYLFSIGEPKMLGKHRKVYVHFKAKHRNLSATSAKQYLSDVSAGAPLYRTIADPLSHPYPDEGINRLLIDISNTKMESSTPFVLSVLQALTAETLSDDSARAILHETLVLLVRRKMTELATTQYDKMFPALLGNIINEPNQVRAIHDRFKKHGVWVSDQEFEDALRDNQAYRRNEKPFSGMLLIEIDKRFETHGQFPDYSTLNTIEHVIPQTLNDEWRDYLGPDAEDEHLPTVIHTIGNLCLLSGPANSGVGQDPFESKKKAYSPVSALARQIKEHDGRWDINAVRARSRMLAKVALEIWAWTNE
ncbi:DUF262 domain-containing protein [Candidatus Eisenbacteria bacterium]|uniref:DUF262 domain-containing protein n=1 Tax=Eiseniibacteriota bacterium TaxID=2212470 RepID=A0ABV6YMM2_UNCEI